MGITQKVRYYLISSSASTLVLSLPAKLHVARTKGANFSTYPVCSVDNGKLLQPQECSPEYMAEKKQPKL